VDGLREVERELERDRGARGVANDVRPGDPELTHEQPAVLCVERHGDRTVDRAAASEPGAVVAEHAIPVRESRLVQKRLGPRRSDPPVDQHDGVAGAPKLVLQLEAVDRPTFHLIESGMNLLLPY
jgi:hypothetical protein